MKVHVTRPNGATFTIDEIVDKAIREGSLRADFIAKSDRNKFNQIASQIIEKARDEYTFKMSKGRAIYLNKKQVIGYQKMVIARNGKKIILTIFIEKKIN